MTQEQWDSSEESQRRHDKWGHRRRLRRFQESKAASAGMTWEQWQEHKARLRAVPPSERARYLRNYRATPRGKAVFKAASLKSRAKVRGVYEALKRGACMDCGGRFHSSAMEWDHRDGAQKSFCLSYQGREGRVSEAVLRAEIAKCDLVCANCHRVRTARRRAGLPAVLPAPEYEI